MMIMRIILIKKREREGNRKIKMIKEVQGRKTEGIDNRKKDQDERSKRIEGK